MKTYLLAIFLCFLSVISYAQEEVPSSSDLIDVEAITDTLDLGKAAMHLSKLVNEKKIVEAEEFADRLIKKSHELNYDRGLGHFYGVKSEILKRNKKYLKAIRSLDKAEQHYKNVNAYRGLADVYNRRGILENQRGNIEKSADYLLEAKMYREKIGDSIGLAIILNNLGSIYASLENLEESAASYRKAVEIRKKINRTHNIGMVMNNLAIISLRRKLADSTEAIVLEALEINKKDSIDMSIAHSYSILGELALLRKEYQKAKKYYDTTYAISSTTSWDLLTIDCKQQLGLIAIHLKDFNKAEELLEYSRKQYTDYGAVQLMLKNYQFTSKLDSARGDFKSALSWQKKYQELSDKRMAELSTEKMERAESRYKAELENMRMIDEQAIREEKTNTELFKYRLFSFLTFGILVGISIFMFIIIKTRKERKRLIAQLNTSNQVKNKLFSIISHDLKNEISGLDNSLKLLNDQTISQEEFREIVPLLTNRTQQTSIMLHNLLNWSKSQLKELNAKPSNFDMSDLISKKFEFFRTKADKKNIKLINELNHTHIYADESMVGIVAQNLIANAIKFCNPGDSISLLSEEKDNYYEISFKDTGVGIPPEYLNKLFAEETFTTRGTQNEAGTGLGLRICKELIELNNGKIKVDSSLGEGSTFSVILPKSAA